MSENLKTVETDRPDIVKIVGIGLSGVFLTVALILFLEGLFYREQAMQEVRKVAPFAEFQQYRDEQLRDLSSYRYVAKEKGIIGIPIEQAMKILVEEKGK